MDDTNNYRGMSLLSTTSKIFTKIVNDRLLNWVERLNLITEAQAGFRKGYSTMDHIFTLQSIAHRYLSNRKGRMYCIFVDFSKVFDCVRPDYLWHRLI